MMSFQAVTQITSSSPKQVNWYGREPRPSNASLVWYEGQEGEGFALSLSFFFTSEVAWFWQDPVNIASEPGQPTDTTSAAIEREFVQLVRQIPEVERIFIRKDEDFMRIWTVIHDVNIDAEDSIYEAQMRFMDEFRGFPCDFSVIFRQELDLTTLKPVGAQVLFSR